MAVIMSLQAFWVGRVPITDRAEVIKLPNRAALF